MQCDDFEPRLQELLDDPAAAPEQIAGDRQLAGHAAECASCRQLLSTMLAVVGEEAVRRLAPCPAAITGRVLAQMRPAGPRMLPLRWAIPLAAAASLIVAVPVWVLWLSGPRLDPSQIAQTPIESQPVKTAAPPSGMAEAGAGPQADFSLDLGLTGLGLTGLGDDVREGLAPVTRSTASTLESLWQAISPAEDRQT